RGKTEAASSAVGFGDPESGPRVGDFQHQRVFMSRGAHRDAAGTAALRNSVNYGVLDERLQDHARNESVCDFAANVFDQREPVGESNALDLQVVRDELHFHPYGDLSRTITVERYTQQLTQAGEHLHDRVVAAFKSEHRYGVQGIEQKMRLELRNE